MADKSFGVKELRITGTGTPTIESPGGGNLNLNAATSTFSGNVSVTGAELSVGKFKIKEFSNNPILHTNTSDGSDNLYLGLNGGGATSHSRGSGVFFIGNEYTSIGGTLQLYAGNVSTGDILLQTQELTRVKIDYDGSVEFSGDINANGNIVGDSATNISGINQVTATTFNGSLAASNLTGALPAISAANLTNVPAPTPTNSDIQVVYVITANGSSHFRFAGNGIQNPADDPNLYLQRGQKYRFINNSGGSHPFQIQETNGSAYTTGVTYHTEHSSGSNSASTGNIDFAVKWDAPSQLKYVCTSHSQMAGDIYLLGGGGDEILNGALAVNGNVDLGNATSDTITVFGRFDSNIIPSTDGQKDLGSAAYSWGDLWIDGAAWIDHLNANTVDIDGGSIDGTPIGSSSPNTGAFSTLSASGNADFDGNLDVAGTLDVDGNVDFDGNLDVAGSLTVTGGFSSDHVTINNAAGNVISTSAGNLLLDSTGGTVSVQDNFSVTGNTTLGNGSDDLFIYSAIRTNLTPHSDSDFDLGSSTKEWKNIYGTNFISSNGQSRFNTTETTFPFGTSTYDAAVTISGDNDHGGTQRNAALQIHNTSLLNNWGIVIRSKSDPSLAMIFYDDDNDNCGRIQINNNSTDFVTSSDYRIKENETLISDGITRLKQLKPYRFNFKKSPSTTRDGFFAHEVQSVVPEAVTGTKDEVDSDGNMMVQGIDKSKLIPLLTAALQEEVAKREALEARVAALEGS